MINSPKGSCERYNEIKEVISNIPIIDIEEYLRLENEKKYSLKLQRYEDAAKLRESEIDRQKEEASFQNII